MKSIEKTGRTVDDAITEALIELGMTSEEVDIEVLDKGANGLLGLFSNKKAKVRVIPKLDLKEVANDFLKKIFHQMELEVTITIEENEKQQLIIDLSGDNMGVIIGKRGQTLDSLQHLVSLVVNKQADHYVRVKMDTENYRVRRKKALENLAANLSYKVKKSNRKFVLEPMNPYERRVIHSVLQGNKDVETHSEGDEPYRRVVIVPKTNH